MVALRNVVDHSDPVLTCHLASAMAKTTSADPKHPFLSSSSWTKCIEERIWLRSRDSPQSNLSHWEEGVPSRRLLATRKRALTPAGSSLNWRRVQQVSTQLLLRAELMAGSNHGISSSWVLRLTTHCSPSSSSSSSTSSPLETQSRKSSTSSQVLLSEGLER